MVVHPIELGFVVPDAALAPGSIRCLASCIQEDGCPDSEVGVPIVGRRPPFFLSLAPGSDLLPFLV